MIAELQIGEQILKYKSPFALQREHDEIYRFWFWDEYEKFKRVDDLCKALIDGDADALAKAVSPELTIARADVAELRKKYGAAAGRHLHEKSTERLAALMREFTKRVGAIKEEERRSRRFNEAWCSPPSAPTIH
jgi:hypothetical protein